MRRKLLIASLTVIFLVVVAIGISAWLINDEDFLKNRLTHYAHEYTGRELAVTGPLDLSLGRETTIEAHGISFSNAPWAENPEMVRIGRVKVALDIPSLFDDFPYLPYFLLEDCSIELLKNEAGEANW